MEKEVAPQKRQHCRTTVLSIISSLCSVASVAFCILLSINTADIKTRLVDLENVDGERGFVRAPGYSLDDFNSLIQQRVNELLSQVRTAGANPTVLLAQNYHNNCIYSKKSIVCKMNGRSVL